MSKIMLVEDDNNLREIYEARLAAEGYEIVSAQDGEAALALGVKEKPDLIIADIMMPKVSGFDMLDIMRTTNETKNAKIIMMTALNQAEDKAKAEQLGADLYLVKSQVTLEDVVRSAKKLLGEETPLNIGGVAVEHPENQAGASPTTTPMTGPAGPVPQPATPAPADPAPTNTPAAPATPQPAPAPVTTQTQSIPVNSAPATPAPADPAPTNTPSPTPPTTTTPEPTPPTTNNANSNADSTGTEEAILQKQIEQFITEENPTISTEPTKATQPAPTTVTEPAPAAPATPQPAPVQPAPSPQQPASSMASPPRDMPANDPQTTALSDDKPSGERTIQKNADNVTAEGGIPQNAEISGRKKVIKPISDMLTKGPNLDALLEKEKTTQPGTAPTVNSVVTPEGITSTPNQKGGTMSDVIAPNPSAAPKLDPNRPPAPPVA